jgi:uncharacterized membrane protein
MKKSTYKIIITASFIGLLISLYLWYLHVQNQIPICVLSGCADVATSKWSILFGIPVATWGFFYYVLLSITTLEAYFIRHQLLNKFMYFLVGAGVLFSFYLRYLEIFVIKNWCIWCWGSFVMILLIALLCIIENRKIFFFQKIKHGRIN